MKKIIIPFIILILMISLVQATIFTNSDGSIIVSAKDPPTGLWGWFTSLFFPTAAAAGTYTSLNCPSSVCVAKYGGYYLYKCTPNSDGSQASWMPTTNPITSCPATTTTIESIMGAITPTTTTTTTTPTITPSTCLDSDLSNSPTFEGSVTIGSGNPVYDRCSDTNPLQSGEVYCYKLNDGSYSPMIQWETCPSGYSCSPGNKACKAGTVAPPIVIGCTDNDGGSVYISGETTRNDLGTKGEARRDSLVADDYCLSATEIYEGVCQSTGYPTWKKFTCPSGTSCSGGACVSGTTPTCVDPDGGKKEYVAGTTTNPNYVRKDSCSGDILTEYYCEGNTIISDDITCSSGCENGACKAGIGNCFDSDASIGDLINQKYVKGFANDSSQKIIDSCKDSTYVYEAFCITKDKADKIDVKCENGCDIENGACKGALPPCYFYSGTTKIEINRGTSKCVGNVNVSCSVDGIRSDQYAISCVSKNITPTPTETCTDGSQKVTCGTGMTICSDGSCGEGAILPCPSIKCEVENTKQNCITTEGCKGIQTCVEKTWAIWAKEYQWTACEKSIEPITPPTTCTKDESCTKDNCDGIKKCTNGILGECVKTDSSCGQPQACEGKITSMDFSSSSESQEAYRISHRCVAEGSKAGITEDILKSASSKCCSGICKSLHSPSDAISGGFLGLGAGTDYYGYCVEKETNITLTCESQGKVTCDSGECARIKEECPKKASSYPYTEWKELPIAARLTTLCRDKTQCELYEDLAGTGKEYYVECKSVSQIQGQLKSDVEEICKSNAGQYLALGLGSAGAFGGCLGGALIGGSVTFYVAGFGAIPGCIMGAIAGAGVAGTTGSAIGNAMYVNCKDKTVPKDVGACMAIPKGQTFGQFQWCDIAGKANFIKFQENECGSGTINIILYAIILLIFFAIVMRRQS